MTAGLAMRGGLLVTPLEPRHLAELEVQPSQAYLAAQLADPESFAGAVRALGPAFAGLIDGRPMIAAGILEQWAGRWIAWAILSAAAGPHMAAITRAVRVFLDLQPGRIEAWTHADSPKGAAWARLLRFELEAPRLRAAFPGGGDATLWSRVRP